MCYHIATPSKKKLKLHFPEHIIYYEGFENYHISALDRPYLPVTLNNKLQSIGAARWKLIPYWIHNEEDANLYTHTFNATAESIYTKRSYKPYIQRQRGLLYVNGYFETNKALDHSQTNTYFIYQENKEIFTLGIVYAMFDNHTSDESYPTFAIITTPANNQLSSIHNPRKRMPLIISPENRLLWLQSTNKTEINNLMKPYNGNLAFHRIINVSLSNLVVKNTPNIQKPI